MHTNGHTDTDVMERPTHPAPVVGGRTLSMTALKQRVARPARVFDETAACRRAETGVTAAEWTPEYEEERVPARLQAICADCPLWQDCLSEALRMNDIGYRASTTTKQRRKFFADLVPARGAEARVATVSRGRFGGDADRAPTHQRGAGSLNSYRRGCRCDECRGHNAAARRRERARAS